MDSYSIEQTNHSYEVIIDELMTDYGQQILQLVMQLYITQQLQRI